MVREFRNTNPPSGSVMSIHELDQLHESDDSPGVFLKKDEIVTSTPIATRRRSRVSCKDNYVVLHLSRNNNNGDGIENHAIRVKATIANNIL